MPVLEAQPDSLLPEAGDLHRDVASALTERSTYLVASLSGGSGSWYTATERVLLPATMLQPSTFDDTADEESLTVVNLVPVDEAADEW